VDRTVNSTLDVFRKALVWNDNGLYSGELVVSFFDKRETKEFLGFVTKQEKIYFERWKLSIDLIDATHQGQQATSQVDAYQSAYSQVRPFYPLFSYLVFLEKPSLAPPLFLPAFPRSCLVFL
jgi:hypothetical protein